MNDPHKRDRATVAFWSNLPPSAVTECVSGPPHLEKQSFVLTLASNVAECLRIALDVMEGKDSPETDEPNGPRRDS